jgi:phosphopantothenoylcysteine decarboxylase/phosphopantothenate--cysteine ligase
MKRMPKTIGIGITGGIACYKIADLVSRLKKEGHDVIVMMTEGATKFVNPLTFRTLSGREVVTDLWRETNEWKVQHIGVAEALDLLVIAPATANFIGKMAGGIADNFLSTVVLANTAPVLVAPAMNSNMYMNPIVQDNVKKLQQHGVNIIKPESGILACGVEGPGRLANIATIYEEIMNTFTKEQDLRGKRILVNAGSTCEDIDPVRFIGNRATGRMGYAIAKEAVKRGAEVVLISGRSVLEPPVGVKFIPVWSAAEMNNEMQKHQPDADVIIGAAAIGDFKVANIAKQKIKKTNKSDNRLILELVGTVDVLKELGKKKLANQIMVGFAAETENVLENAQKKLISKNLDFIVANDLTVEGAGFGVDTNVVTFINSNGTQEPLPKMTKEKVAEAILNKIVALVNQ